MFPLHLAFIFVWLMFAQQRYLVPPKFVHWIKPWSKKLNSNCGKHIKTLLYLCGCSPRKYFLSTAPYFCAEHCLTKPLASIIESVGYVFLALISNTSSKRGMIAPFSTVYS